MVRRNGRLSLNVFSVAVAVAVAVPVCVSVNAPINVLRNVCLSVSRQSALGLPV